MQSAVIRHRHVIPPIDPVAPLPAISPEFDTSPDEGTPRQHVRINQATRTFFALESDPSVRYALDSAPTVQTIAFLRRAGYTAYFEKPGGQPLLQRHHAVNELLNLGNLALREGSVEEGTYLLEITEPIQPYPPPRDPVLGLVAPHSRYCVACGGPSPHKILCDLCLAATEWQPAAFCNACCDPHCHQSNAQFYCPACWRTISQQLAAEQPAPMRCEQLVALGYWQAERCCSECHAGSDEQLYGLQLRGNSDTLRTQRSRITHAGCDSSLPPFFPTSIVSGM